MRPVSLPLYALAFGITLIIFLLGIYVGEQIAEGKEQSIHGDLEDLNDRLSSAQLLFLLEDSANFSSEFCPLYATELSELDERTDRIGYRLSYLEETQGTVDVELKQSYFVLETQAYLLTRRMNERCMSDYPVILYFYSNANCPDCYEQGAALLALKQSHPTTRIYSFDGTLGSSVADALKTEFNATRYPSLVVNGRLYAGLQSAEEILEIVGER